MKELLIRHIKGSSPEGHDTVGWLLRCFSRGVAVSISVSCDLAAHLVVVLQSGAGSSFVLLASRQLH